MMGVRSFQQAPKNFSLCLSSLTKLYFEYEQVPSLLMELLGSNSKSADG